MSYLHNDFTRHFLEGQFKLEASFRRQNGDLGNQEDMPDKHNEHLIMD